ncbi:MAG: FAD-binding oxidoreductase, partial [Gammaproteobacteria bacterium]|nr:FAD-binding oxidoreductase [Gammaproteobacteria bacterium]
MHVTCGDSRRNRDRASCRLLLRGDRQRCDVAIIGGGFSGVATALSLAERGYDVILMEQNKIGWGASGRNGGQLINGFGGAKRIRHEFGESVEDL